MDNSESTDKAKGSAPVKFPCPPGVAFQGTSSGFIPQEQKFVFPLNLNTRYHSDTVHTATLLNGHKLEFTYALLDAITVDLMNELDMSKVSKIFNIIVSL